MVSRNIEVSKNPFFTIFTPTFNRKHTLPRLIDSLRNAGSVEFEWLVIDDGSCDDTYEWLLEEMSNLDFPVRVYRQENGGKQSCHNAAVELAEGDMIIILDSDDELAPKALNILKEAWDSIPSDKRHQFAGVLGNTADEYGHQIGALFPTSPMDGNHFLLTIGGMMTGDKLPCYRRDILVRFPFPATPVRQVIPEGLVWHRIARKYFIRCINYNVAIVHRDKDDEISLMNSYKNPSSNSYGNYIYFRDCVEYFQHYKNVKFVNIFKYNIQHVRYGIHANINLRKLIDVRAERIFLSFAFFMGGVAFWLKDQAAGFFADNHN